jgi:hypothetical protein
MTNRPFWFWFWCVASLLVHLMSACLESPIELTSNYTMTPEDTWQVDVCSSESTVVSDQWTNDGSIHVDGFLFVNLNATEFPITTPVNITILSTATLTGLFKQVNFGLISNTEWVGDNNLTIDIWQNETVLGIVFDFKRNGSNTNPTILYALCSIAMLFWVGGILNLVYDLDQKDPTYCRGLCLYMAGLGCAIVATWKFATFPLIRTNIGYFCIIVVWCTVIFGVSYAGMLHATEYWWQKPLKQDVTRVQLEGTRPRPSPPIRLQL